MCNICTIGMYNMTQKTIFTWCVDHHSALGIVNIMALSDVLDFFYISHIVIKCTRQLEESTDILVWYE